MLNKKRWKHLHHLGDRAKPVIPVGVGAKWNRTEVQLGGVPAIHSLFQPASSFSAADEKPSLQTIAHNSDLSPVLSEMSVGTFIFQNSNFFIKC